MSKYFFSTHTKKLLADLHTPVGIYLQIRDQYPGSLLLESTDFHVKEDSWSFIAINPIAGIEIKNGTHIEYKFPLQEPVKEKITTTSFLTHLEQFKQSFQAQNTSEIPCVQGLFGYTSFDSAGLFLNLQLQNQLENAPNEIAMMRYRLYQYVIAINHFNDTLYLCENQLQGLESHVEKIETLLLNKQFVSYPFALCGQEKANRTDDNFKDAVVKAKQHCQRGDVFQMVLSRSYEQEFTGDELNVYRHLRNINPSPYLFYFDYIDYKIFGSSPESQVIVNGDKVIVHPIAGTVKRSGNDAVDLLGAEKLLQDKKENAEHTMLVDLARNDLSIHCKNVRVNYLKQIKFYSHVIHLVSEVQGTIEKETPLFELLASTFPAGTLSGAPKRRAIELIDANEPTARGFYGGAIGFVGFSQQMNHAIVIRSFLSKNNTLFYQAGAGIVIDSVPENEKKEVDNKLAALKKALLTAQSI